MIVCVCNAVSDRDVRREIEAGASCLEDLTERLGVANCCGACAQCAEQLLLESPLLAPKRSSLPDELLFAPNLALSPQARASIISPLHNSRNAS
jgi:bacterioferritin-associated ferredoxin